MNFENIIIGKPLVDPWKLLAINQEDWENTEKEKTLFTDKRFLPHIMKEIDMVKSVSEVKRNQPNLFISLDNLDFLIIKWGKKKAFIIVGE